MKKLIFICLSLLIFCGCNSTTNHDGTSVEIADNAPNSDFHVERLFTVDGITIYRFYDHSHYHYFGKNNEGITVNTTYREGDPDNTIIYSENINTY